MNIEREQAKVICEALKSHISSNEYFGLPVGERDVMAGLVNAIFTAWPDLRAEYTQYEDSPLLLIIEGATL